MQPQTERRAHPQPVRERRGHRAAHTAEAVASGAGVVGTARMPVSVPPVRQRERFAHRLQIDRLAAGHAARTTGPGEQLDHRQLPCWIQQPRPGKLREGE